MRGRSIIVAATVLTLSVDVLMAKEKKAPGSRILASVAAFKRARECIDLRSMRDFISHEIELRRDQVQKLQEKTKTQRTELENCANDSGISEKDEQLLAEVCANSFEAWVTSANGIELIEDQIVTHRERLSDTQSYLTLNCKERHAPKTP